MCLFSPLSPSPSLDQSTPLYTAHIPFHLISSHLVSSRPIQSHVIASRVLCPLSHKDNTQSSPAYGFIYLNTPRPIPSDTKSSSQHPNSARSNSSAKGHGDRMRCLKLCSFVRDNFAPGQTLRSRLRSRLKSTSRSRSMPGQR